MKRINDVLEGLAGSYELVWSNANGIDNKTSLAGNNFDVILSKPVNLFMGFLVEFRATYNDGARVYANTVTGASGMFGIAYAFNGTGNPILVFRRDFWPLDAQTLRFSACTRMSSNAANVVGQDTGCLVPLRIWGIKKSK